MCQRKSSNDCKIMRSEYFMSWLIYANFICSESNQFNSCRFATNTETCRSICATLRRRPKRAWESSSVCRTRWSNRSKSFMRSPVSEALEMIPCLNYMDGKLRSCWLICRTSRHHPRPKWQMFSNLYYLVFDLFHLHGNCQLRENCQTFYSLRFQCILWLITVFWWMSFVWF